MQIASNFAQLIFNANRQMLRQPRFSSTTSIIKCGKAICEQQPQQQLQQRHAVKGIRNSYKYSMLCDEQQSQLQKLKLKAKQRQLNVTRAISGFVTVELVKPAIKCRPFLVNSLTQGRSLCLILLPMAPVHCASSAANATNRAFSTSSSDQSDNKNQDDMSAEVDYKNAKSIYDFTVKDTHGNDVSLEQYKGHVVLIVNIASKCGLTKNNYQKLTELKNKFHDRGLRILNFPCNQFGSQMPESDGEPMVCHLRDSKADIGDVFQKIDVNGSNAAPLYKYLKEKQSGTLGSGIKWNFTKFLVNKEGIPVDRYAPTTDPMDIAKDIEKLL